ncbi:MAG: cupin domain-containing protein [Mediterranea sp.]|jgi:predicted cupin superfamily sugar epimerase|nr:cupin domain-containing protein [Mediterranea sp.]
MTENFTSEEIIRELGMLPHPEGGYYKETYRSLTQTTLADGRVRNVCTAIYYLMQDDDISHLHRIASDETWLFHQGQSVEIVIVEQGALRIERLGNNLPDGEHPQVVVPAGAWFGARLKGGIGHALVSCLVSPGFDFEDFELGREADFEGLECLEQIRGMISR